MDTQEEFIQKLQAHQGLINKLLFLYADDAEERKDLQQEIMLQAWHSYGGFRGNSQFSTWLFRLGLNCCMTNLRIKKRLPKDNSEAPTPTSHPDKSTELLQELKQHLNELEKALMMALVEGYSNEEIAQMLGISENNARVKIHRLRKKLNSHGYQ